MIELATLTLVYIAFVLFSVRRLLNYLHALQQDDYDNGRLLDWIWVNRVFDKRFTAAIIFITLIQAAPQFISYFYAIPEVDVSFLNFLVFLAFLICTKREKDPRKDSKKALILTKRAQRIFIPALVLAGILGAVGFVFKSPVFWIAPVQFLPLILIFSNFSLQPYESYIQQEFYKEAKAKLNTIRPTVIGITGSYGKTSVKHILGHILKSTAPTLITPGSVNTLMGITRIIREQLEPNHQYFVVEMGAYGPGSIASLCDLTPPDFGIITSIGHAHYERFKSLDTVAQAKYELAESVLRKSGKVIVHEKTLRFAHAREIKNNAASNFIVCGEPPKPDNPKEEISYLGTADMHIKLIEQSTSGLKVVLEWRGTQYTLQAPLYGLHHGHNIALAFACALSVGIEAADAIAALTRTPQIPHRLELKPQPDSSTIIDDAYNSNPLGFRSALDLLALLKGQGRAILVTPGIVELGLAHDEVHRKLGEFASSICDVVVLVQPERIPTFIDGFRSTGKGKELKEFDTFAQAQEWIIANKKAGDIILLENDLPDIYERIPRI